MKYLKLLMVLALAVGVWACGNNKSKDKIVGGNTYTTDPNTGGIPLGGDSDSGGGGGGGLGGVTTADFTGTWTGTISFSVAAAGVCSSEPADNRTGTITISLAQSGNTVTGTSVEAGDPVVSTLSGTVNGSVLTAQETGSTTNCGGSPAIVTYKLTLNSATQSTLVLSGNACFGCNGISSEGPGAITGGGTLTKP